LTYFDRKGQPLTVMEWDDLIENHGYRRIALTEFPDGSRVSTVWLGIDHGWGRGPPVIFETMIFESGGWYHSDCVRYSTEEEAIAGHDSMVQRWKNRGRKNEGE